MTPRTLFLIQLIDKLGAPLMGAVQGGESDKDSAETLAGLLSSSVKLGLSLTDKMGLHEEDGDMDSVRVALSASAAHMVADYYAQHKKIPLDEDHEQISKSVDALISFAENFTASKDHTGRLRNMGDDKPLFDAAQSQIFYLNAMQPVLAAVAAFSFGQSETRLLQEIAEKLQTRAAALREALGGSGADDGEARFTELMILHALARIYTGIHTRKTGELEKAGESAQEASAEDVWKEFDHQIAMLEILLEVALPPSEDGAAAAAPQASEPKASAPPEQKTEAPAQPEQSAEIPAAPAAEEKPAPAQAAPTEEQSQAQPGNPMGFFTKKPEEAPEAAAEATPETPATQPESTPAETAQAPEKEEEKPAPQGNPSNPMSFFTPGSKSDSE